MTIDLARAKAQARVTHNAEDVLIAGYIAAAKAWIERYTGKLIAPGEVVDTFTAFGDYVALSRGPFIELTTIAYVDADGADQELAAARPRDGRIYAPIEGWPTIADYSTVTVTYQAGYDTAPPELDQAMLLLIAHWHSNREAAVVGTITNELKLAVEELAGPFRLPTLR